MKVENIKVTSRGRRAHVELEVTTDVPIESSKRYCGRRSSVTRSLWVELLYGLLVALAAFVGARRGNGTR